MLNSKLLCKASLLVVASTQLANATIVVYTDYSAWESAAQALSPYPTLSQDFESIDPQALSTGDNSFFTSSGVTSIYISGDPGFNAIDDSATSDSFGGTLSPNGSTYYLGETNGSVPSLSFYPFAGVYPIPAFGAEWVTGGNLVMDVRGISVSFADYLPTGSGFLGVVEDQGHTLNDLTLRSTSGAAYFGMDEASYVVTPIPAAVWLFGSGLLGLIGLARRKT